MQKPTKNVFARMRHFLRSQYREYIFRQSMKKYLENPEACMQADSRILSRLIYGWGNEAWSALNEYLSACIKQALITKGPILECGSGLSTILVGAIAKNRGIRHWALEHTDEWASRVKSYLDRYKIDSVVLSSSPLKSYKDYSWYNPPLELMPNDYTLVLCDGPPGTTEGGRYGLVPVMRTKFGPDCTILLDDANREREQETAICWAKELGAKLEVSGNDNRYIRIQLSGSSRSGS